MRIGESFHIAYQKLEQRMKALAEADGDVFLPNPEPSGPVRYVLICMEPSFSWARSAKHGRWRVEAGFRNFLASIEVQILHFCVRRYLCRAAERYHITDLSKGAILVHHARLARSQRYDRWYGLLQEEIDLCTTRNARIIAVGKAVFQYLKRRGFQRPLYRTIHYSGQAAVARTRGVVGREDSFRAFRDSVSLEDVMATAKDVLNEAHTTSAIRDEVLSQLAKSRLTESRQKLIFTYKLAFESIRS